MSRNSIKEAYRHFLNTRHGADVYRHFKRILYTAGDSLVQTLDTQILESLAAARRTPLKICDIGGGDGERVVRIVQFLREKFHGCFELDFVEQSNLYVEEFKRRQPETFCPTKIHLGLFEQMSLQAGQYDLVLLIHSIFAFENGNAVDKVLSLRSPSGKVVVVANAPDSFLGGLKALVDEGFDDQRYEVDDLKLSLAERGIQVRELRFSTEWAIAHEDWQRDLAILLDWISLGRFDSFPATRKRAVLAYIESRSHEDNGRHFFAEDEVVLVVPNSD